MGPFHRINVHYSQYIILIVQVGIFCFDRTIAEWTQLYLMLRKKQFQITSCFKIERQIVLINTNYQGQNVARKMKNASYRGEIIIVFLRQNKIPKITPSGKCCGSAHVTLCCILFAFTATVETNEFHQKPVYLMRALCINPLSAVRLMLCMYKQFYLIFS